MKTEHRLALALKEMLTEVSLDEISVRELVKKCHVNRQTFYYHFHDIFDLLTLLFLTEKVEGVKQTKNVEEVIECLFKYYEKNEKFINATLNSSGKDLFVEFVNNVFYTSLIRFINAIPDSKKITLQERRNIARFYASAYAHQFVFYLTSSKNKSLNSLNLSFNFIYEDFLIRAITIKIRRKEK